MGAACGPVRWSRPSYASGARRLASPVDLTQSLGGISGVNERGSCSGVIRNNGPGYGSCTRPMKSNTEPPCVMRADLPTGTVTLLFTDVEFGLRG